MMFRLMEKSSGYLFASRNLRELMDSHVSAMRQEIDQLDANRLLNTSQTDLASYLIEKYKLQAPLLRRNDWSVSEHET